MPRPRRRQPDPARFPPCARCGKCYPGGADGWPEGRVCKYCYLEARLCTGTCVGCGALTSLPGLNATGQPACTRCSGIPARFRCGCGREVTAGERGRCWWCVLTALVTDVLAGPGGEVPAQLRPLAEGLMSMRRPQSGVVWLRRSAITREILRDLAQGRIPGSHATLDAAGADRAVEYLRVETEHLVPASKMRKKLVAGGVPSGRTWGNTMNPKEGPQLTGIDTKAEAPAPGPNGLLEHAKALLAQGHTSESEDAFRQLCASPAHAAEGRYGIGMARLAAGDLEAAGPFFDQALKLDPANANALYQLGVIAEKSGHSAAARSYYGRALAIVPGHAGARQRLRAISPEPVPAAARSEPVPAAAPPSNGGPSGSAIYDYLRQDPSPLSRQTLAAMDALEMKVHPTFTAYAGRHFARFAILAGLALIAVIGLPVLVAALPQNVNLPVDLTSLAGALIIAVPAIAAAAAALGYVRVRSTCVTIHCGRLQIRKGVLSRRLVNVDLWHVRGIELKRTFLNRLTGDGTLVLELVPQPALSRSRRTPAGDGPVQLTGIVRGKRLEEVYQQLLNVAFLLRSNPIVKGIIQ